ncbi:hypothetical protein FOL47_010377 [Perkinsus chesapeaki]|uniref:Kinesin motor domain-containing protein n=1 Tax=Perkinsus chesapeaki TaxID=330153 RepID=A0A7J6N1N2_PERCH|nr:hypothetical protein FOL47_010377 [Perkinsus chesapeaki]
MEPTDVHIADVASCLGSESSSSSRSSSRYSHHNTNHVRKARHMTCGWDSDVDASAADSESVAAANCDLEVPSSVRELAEDTEEGDEERRLTEKVPELLDAMNTSAERLNDLERELSTIEKRRHHLASEWRRRKQQLLPLIGRSVLERTKAYYEACAALGDSQQAVHAATGEFKKAVEDVERIKKLMSGAEEEFALEGEGGCVEARESYSTGSTVGDDKESSAEPSPIAEPSLRPRTSSSIPLKSSDEQDRLAELSVELLAAQSSRDAAERACITRTSEYRSIQNLISRIKRDTTERAIKKAEPWYSDFAKFSELSNNELVRAGKVKTAIRATKKKYQDTMKELECISNKLSQVVLACALAFAGMTMSQGMLRTNEAEKRKALTRKIIKGDFNVAVRVRPPLKRELLASDYCHIVSVDGPQLTLSEVVSVPMTGSVGGGGPARIAQATERQHQILANHVFTFDTVYDEDSRQPDVYQRTAKDAVMSVLQGYNATILAYGQTGTGKTHTMEGFVTDYHDHSQRGIIPRSMAEIFEYADLNRASDATFRVRASYLQIYNEALSDLLPREDRPQLNIRQDKSLGVYVDGLAEHIVREPEEVYTLITEGNASRAIATTKLNDASSRSHAVFTIVVEIVDDNSTLKVGKLNLVDLAGSERVRLTGATGVRLEESKKINQSLSALGNVISALTEASRAESGASGAGRSHIPYRDSKLTRLLEDSLGGNCITAMIAMISPAAEAFGESLSTLKFANRAKTIRNTAVMNEFVSDQDALIRKYEAELQRLRAELAKRPNSAVNDRQLLKMDEERRRAEEDRTEAYRRLQHTSREFERQRESNEALTERVRHLQNQLLHPALGDGNERYMEQLRLTEEALEREREALENDKMHVDRYKSLLIKQRDIMLALTTRLDDRDQIVAQLQKSKEVQDRELIQLRERISELETREQGIASTESTEIGSLMGRILKGVEQIVSPDVIREQLNEDVAALHRLLPTRHYSSLTTEIVTEEGPPNGNERCISSGSPTERYRLRVGQSLSTRSSTSIYSTPAVSSRSSYRPTSLSHSRSRSMDATYRFAIDKPNAKQTVNRLSSSPSKFKSGQLTSRLGVDYLLAKRKAELMKMHSLS